MTHEPCCCTESYFVAMPITIRYDGDGGGGGGDGHIVWVHVRSSVKVALIYGVKANSTMTMARSTNRYANDIK